MVYEREIVMKRKVPDNFIGVTIISFQTEEYVTKVEKAFVFDIRPTDPEFSDW